jgi:hypothetical protein
VALGHVAVSSLLQIDFIIIVILILLLLLLFSFSFPFPSLISRTMTSRAAYAAHLQGTIMPSLHNAREAIARLDKDINE